MAPLLIEKEGVSIHVRAREHLPPHVHVFYGDDVALVEIKTGEIYEGYIPGKKLRIVQEWLSENDNRKKVEENFYELNERLRPKKEEKNIVVKKILINKKRNNEAEQSSLHNYKKKGGK